MKFQKLDYGPSRSQYVEVYQPFSRPLALAYVVHGGVFRARYNLRTRTACVENLPAYFVSLGYMCCLVEYRRRGDDATWGCGVTDLDVRTGLERVCALPEAQGLRVLVLPHSFGCSLALLLPRVHLQILLAPVGDLCLAAELGLSDDGKAIQYHFGREPPYESCPAQCARSGMLTLSDTVIVGGTHDVDVPMSYVRKVHKVLTESGYACALKVCDSDHYEMIDPASSSFEKVVQPFIHSFKSEESESEAKVD